MSAVLTFPVWYFFGMLNAAKWPRPSGIFRRPAVPQSMLDSTYGGMLELAMAVGSADPALAVRLIADCFQDRDWQRQTASELAQLLTRIWGSRFGDEAVPIDLLIEQQPSLPPWKSMLRSQESSLDEMVPWKRVADDREYQALLHWNCASALYWGAYNPAAFETAYSAAATASRQLLPEAKAAGLDLPDGWSPPDTDERTAQCVEFVRQFETTVRPLVLVPRELAECAPFSILLE